MSELESDEARRLEDSATQTRFTWAVIFVALVTVLVGLLAMIKPYNSTDNPSFNYAITIEYFVLTIGMSYTFYAMCRTTFILDLLMDKYEEPAVKSFLETHWKVFYNSLICKKENNEIVFRKKL
jgi:hypothetical protein